MITKTDAIIALDANAEVQIENDVVTWLDGNPNNITEEQILAKITELEEAEETAKANEESLKASAKAKLVAGEPLTEAEADTLVM